MRATTSPTEDQGGPVDDRALPRPTRTALWTSLAIGVAAIAFVAVLATRPSAQTALANSPLLGKPAPAIQGTALDGTAVALEQYRGKFVLVNFVASWCVPCRQEHPELVKFSQRHMAAGDAQILGVIFDDTLPNVRRFFEELGGNWPVAADPDGQIALDYGVRGPPESFLIDPRGFVISKTIGQSTADGIDRLIAQANRAGVKATTDK